MASKDSKSQPERSLNKVIPDDSFNQKGSKKADKTFFVVGIGASAGGIQAASELLKYLPDKLGMAYVIIQHLSPVHPSALTEVLEKQTTMNVHKVKDGMGIEPDNVYVIPPNTYMSITEGHLSLSSEKEGPPHPIDHFFTTLASVYQNNAIGIILSGTATDGTLGVQAIKAEGGITFAQDVSASFKGMPDSAVSSGYVDFILSPEGIVKELIAYANLPYLEPASHKILETNEISLRRIFQLLLQKHDVDFSQYKQTTIRRRIQRRMTLNRLKSLERYIAFLKENDGELDLLYNDLLINVTSFFRDTELYKRLEMKIFPAILKNKKKSEPIRIWIPACATGEEAYSFAISIFEYLDEIAYTTPIHIFATDLSEKAIDKARIGTYNKSILQNISPIRLRRFFNKIDGAFQIIKPIREACIFAKHNLLKDPPFSRMDIVSCQNVLIYLEPNSQKKILESFHYSLKLTGYLLLGKSETIGNATELFEQIDKQYKIYSKKNTRTSSEYKFPLHQSALVTTSDALNNKVPERETEIDIEKETDRLLLSRFVPASVVVNKDLQIFRFHGPISHYLQPAMGKASLHLLKMVRDELMFELRSLLHRAKKGGQAVKKEGIQIYDQGVGREITIEIWPVKSTLKEPYFLILFHEVSKVFFPPQITGSSETLSKDAKDRRITSLQLELQEAREQMKDMSEEFEATREELQSANEEILSSNEELQSINEELETSKEELQSTNEELTTINEELNLRNADLKETIEYAETIIETIREPLVLLTDELKIRTANKAFYELFMLKSEHTQGEYFYNIKDGIFNIPLLKDKLKEIVSKSKSFENFELQHNFPELGEKILFFNATRMLHNDQKNKYLLVIEDVTQSRKSSDELNKSLYLNTTILNSINDIFISVDNNWQFIFINPPAEKFIGKKAAYVLGKEMWNIIDRYKHTILHTYLLESMDTKKLIEFEFFDNTISQWFHYRIYPSQEGLSIYADNITQRKQLEQHQKETTETFQLLVRNSFDIITIFSEDGTIKYQSDAVEQILGYKPEEMIGKNIFKDSIVHPEDIHLHESMFRDAVKRPDQIIKGEFRLYHKNKTSRVMEYVCRSLINDPRVQGVIANYRDITDRKILEEQKEEFIAIASHELKTPVTSVMGYTELLSDIFEETNDPKSAEIVKKLSSQVERLTNLVKDLLDVTKITEGKLKLIEDFYDINELITEVTEDFQLTTHTHQMIVRLQPAKKLWGDRERIGQVLTNLLSNAVKYSPDEKKVIISSEISEHGVTVNVKDFGIGIPSETLKLIFQRFYRVDNPNAKTFPGLGLGLYITAEIIKRQGGTIMVRSTENEGCLFSFTLPYKE